MREAWIKLSRIGRLLSDGSRAANPNNQCLYTGTDPTTESSDEPTDQQGSARLVGLHDAGSGNPRGRRAADGDDLLQLAAARLQGHFYDTLEDFYLAEALEYIEAWRQATPETPAGICGPIGPTEQLPLVARIVNSLGLKLHDAHFWGMDEWVEDGQPVPTPSTRCRSPRPTWSCASTASTRALRMPDAQNLHFPTGDLARVQPELRPGALRHHAGRPGRGEALGVQRPAAAQGQVSRRTRRRRRNTASCKTRVVDLHPMTVIQNARTSRRRHTSRWCRPGRLTVGPSRRGRPSRCPSGTPASTTTRSACA